MTIQRCNLCNGVMYATIEHGAQCEWIKEDWHIKLSYLYLGLQKTKENLVDYKEEIQEIAKGLAEREDRDLDRAHYDHGQDA